MTKYVNVDVEYKNNNMDKEFKILYDAGRSMDLLKILDLMKRRDCFVVTFPL